MGYVKKLTLAGIKDNSSLKTGEKLEYKSTEGCRWIGR